MTVQETEDRPGAARAQVAPSAPPGPAPDRRAGVLAVVGGSLLLAAASLVAAAPPASPLHEPGVVVGLVLLAVVALGAAAAVLPAGRRGPAALARSVVAGVRAVPAPADAALLGAALAAPCAVLVRSTYADADSARLLAAIDHVRRNGLGLLPRTQEVALPHLLLRPMEALGGIVGVSLFDVLAVVALAGLVAALARRLSGSVVGGVAAALALLAAYELLYRTTTAPMYGLMLLLGYGGLWLTSAALRSEGRRQWILAAAAAAALLLAWEAHGVGQVFLAGPGILVLLSGPGRREVAGAAKVLAAMVVLAVPRLLVNVSEGGLSRLRSNRTDFIVTKGYIELINRDYWLLPGTGGRSALLRQLPDLAGRTTGRTVLLLYGLCAVVLLRRRPRLLVCALLGGAFFLAAVLVAEPAPYPRYLLPLVPGAAVVCGVAVGQLASRGALSRLAAGVLVVALGIGAGASLVRVTGDVEDQDDRLAASGLEVTADRITDDRGVIGVRVSRLKWVGSDAPIWSSQFLTEDEYVTFLTWPSDEAVLEVLDRHDIGWVLVSPDQSLELRYDQAWLGPTYHEDVRHVDAVAGSPCFRLVNPSDRYRLYERRPCPAG
jgi:hypothetical protein